MCGIAGIVETQGNGQHLPDLINRMCATIVHRGPDDQGTFVSGQLAMGMRRLSIIDLAHGQQPMFNTDGSIVTVFNGEIYNYRELRQQLQAVGYRFITQSDTEVIVHGYQAWGNELFRRLNGMFAIAVYDRTRRRLVLARDHVGIKPLFYSWRDGRLVWGSEIKTLLASGLVQRQLDFDALGQFMAWEYCPAPTTLLRDVRKLEPGRLLTLDLYSARLRGSRYWRIPASAREAGRKLPSRRDEAKWIDRLDDTLRTAVRRQMVSDVPLGAFLSGGVDSSLITAAMDDPLTFSIGFDDPSYNELRYSQQVADHLQVRHVTEVIRDEVLDGFEHLMHFMDDPIGDSSIFPNYLVSRLARRHVKVVLSGDGGDELFGGYEAYVAAALARQYDRLPGVLRGGMIEPVARMLRPRPSKKGIINKLIRFVEGAGHPRSIGHARWRVFLSEAQRQWLFTPDALAGMEQRIDQHIASLYRESAPRGIVDQALYVDTFSYLPDDILTKVDRMSMAVSLEARVPFLDKAVVELAFALPGSMKLRGRETKYILKRVAENHLPHEIVHRRKEGFSAPLKHWIAGPYRALMDALLDEQRIRQEGIFRWEAVSQLRQEHLSGRRNHAHQLWALMMFQAWQDRWLHGDAAQTIGSALQESA